MKLLLSLLLPFCCDGACLPIHSDRILGRDLAANVPGLEELPPEAFVGYAALPGMIRILRVDELARIGKRHGLQTKPVKDLCFEVPLHTLDTHSALQAMRNTLPPGASIEVIEMSRYKVPQGTMTFPRTGLAVSASTPANRIVLWRGKVQYAPNRSMPVWARVRISRVARFLVALRDLKPGETLQQADVEMREGSRAIFLSDGVESVDGYRIRRSLRAGEEILAKDLAPIPAIERGDEVRVRVESSGAVLETPAKAVSNARAGEAVSLRNPQSGRMFRATAEGRGLATVSLQ